MTNWLILHNISAGEEGIEPSHGGFKGPCLTAWLLPKFRLSHVFHFFTDNILLKHFFNLFQTLAFWKLNSRFCENDGG